MFATVYLIRNGTGGIRQWLGNKDSDSNYQPEDFTLPDKPPLELSDVELLTRLNDEYAMLTDAVVPSVVSIDTNKLEPQRIFDGFGRQHLRTVPTQGQGSGVIVSHEGHVVTNHHVVAGKPKIRVTMYDGQVFTAEVIGEDLILDIAVLKIEGGGPFQPIKFGDSDQVRRGQIAFAFGNPFGLGETVTQGIISAVERSLSDTQRDLIQTDAAINPGNSGGPLVNLQGEIIGINSAIYRPDDRVNSGFQGVGFSIPSNDVKEALITILKRGRLIRGYLGVQMDPNPIAKASLGYDGPGVVVGSVSEDSPAEKAGLQAGDVIVSYDREVTDNLGTLFNLVQRSRVDEEVLIEVWRDGEVLGMKARITARKANHGQRSKPVPQSSAPEGEELLSAIGVQVRDLDPVDGKAGLQGVVVAGISRGGLAERRLVVGDLIEAVNQTAVKTSEEFYRYLAASAPKQPTDLRVLRQSERIRVMLPPLLPDAAEGVELPQESVDDSTSGR
ncbi:MAG: trypsin-like peptidase domain-containing protein [Haloferula sp.]